MELCFVSDRQYVQFSQAYTREAGIALINTKATSAQKTAPSLAATRRHNFTRPAKVLDSLPENRSTFYPSSRQTRRVVWATTNHSAPLPLKSLAPTGFSHRCGQNSSSHSYLRKNIAQAEPSSVDYRSQFRRHYAHYVDVPQRAELPSRPPFYLRWGCGLVEAGLNKKFSACSAASSRRGNKVRGARAANRIRL